MDGSRSGTSPAVLCKIRCLVFWGPAVWDDVTRQDALWRKKQQGSVGPVVIRVSAALSSPLSSSYLPHHDWVLGPWALQETLLPRSVQPAGFNIYQDILQDNRGVERGRNGGRRGAEAEWTAKMKTEKRGWEIMNILLPHVIYFHNRVYVLIKHQGVKGQREESIKSGQKWEKMLIKSKKKDGKLEFL